MRSIGIVGPSYCGSTMMGCILGGLPGVGYIGESHWILDLDHVPRCRCGSADCSLSYAALDGLKHNLPSDWWAALARQLGVEVIVSGDKLPGNYDRLGLPGEVLHLVRDPRGWAVSWLHHEAMRRDDRDLVLEELSLSEPQLRLAASTWRSFHDSIRGWIESRKLWSTEVDVDAFLSMPLVGLRDLCDALHLTFDPAAIHFERKTHHHIHGNAQVGMTQVSGHRPRYHAERRNLRGCEPQPDTAWQRVLSASQADLVLEVACQS